MKWIYISVLGLLALVLMFKSKEGFTRYTGIPYPYSCEFNRDCLWDNSRWVQLSNGMEGVCTMHGLACPAFSKDHSAASRRGLSPTMVENKGFSSGIRPFINGFGLNPPVIKHFQNDKYRWDDPEVELGQEGTNALSLGMYPTNLG